MSRTGSPAQAKPRELTGRMVLAWLVAFFAIVAGVNAVMIRAAISTFGGVETASSYQAGLSFARERAAVAAQDALGWHVDAHAVTAGDGTAVEIVARDAAGRPLTGLAAYARLVHPTDARGDRDVALSQDSAGMFRGTTPALRGQWDLVIALERDGTRVFQSKSRIVLR